MAKKTNTPTTAQATVIASLMKELNADEITALAKLGNSEATADEVFKECPTLAAKLLKNPDIIKGLAGEAAAEAAAEEDDSDDTNLQIALLKKENAKLRKQAAKKSSKKSKKDEDDDDDDDDEDEDDDALFTVRVKDEFNWNRVGEIVVGGVIVSALTIGAVYAINALVEK